MEGKEVTFIDVAIDLNDNLLIALATVDNHVQVWRMDTKSPKLEPVSGPASLPRCILLGFTLDPRFVQFVSVASRTMFVPSSSFAIT